MAQGDILRFDLDPVDDAEWLVGSLAARQL